MKTVKPLRLGALTRTFELNQKSYLTVGVLVCFDLAPDGGIVPDYEIWARVQDELAPVFTLDECGPKPRGEVLVNGSCYTAGGEPRTAASVRVAIGAVDKTLYIVGDRTWGFDGVASDPEPFTRMPIGYGRAFGGAGFPQNPAGIGAAPTTVGGETTVHRLPNVEDPKHLIKSKTDRIGPAGFGPLDKSWPQRWSKMGTYDMHWAKHISPALAPDMDVSVHMTAPEDQQIEGYFRGDEPFTLENMHPDHPTIEGKLPGVFGRCFIRQKLPDGTTPFRELPMRLDTVRFFPHLERGVLVFRALVQVAEDDADDVETLLIACDELEGKRPFEHYESVLAARLDRAQDRGAVLRDRDLIPARLIKQSLKQAFGDDIMRSEGYLKRNARARMEREADKTRGRLVAAGIKPADVKLPDIPPIDDDDDPEALLEKLEKEEAEHGARAQVAAAQSEVRDRLAARGVDYDEERAKQLRAAAGPPKFSADKEIERLRDIQQLAKNAELDSTEIDAALSDPATFQKLRDVEAQLKEGYRRTAHAAEYPADLLDEPRRGEVRAAVERAYRDGLGFEDEDLTGADLSGLDLAGANFAGAFLERANLSGANLSGANFTKAVLARADLSGANLAGAVLREANLGGADLTRADLSCVVKAEGLILSKANLTKAKLAGCELTHPDFHDAVLVEVDFSTLKLRRAMFYKNDLTGSNFKNAELERCSFIDLTAKGITFAGATLERCTFSSAELDGASFLNARMANTRFVRGCSVRDGDFRGADLTKSTLRETDFTKGDFSGATLDQSDLTKAILRDAKFYRASAKRAYFMRAELANASLLGANLEGSFFLKAKLASADFGGANLFRANFQKAKGDTGTSFRDANVTRVFYRPKES